MSIMVTPVLRSENDTPQYGMLSNADTLMVFYRVESIDDVMEFSHHYEVEEGYEEYTKVKYKKKL
ncbi:hypothetical protein [Enterocloster clostridioformis]|uniref:Uncharacterized protein n=1 Tax=Enterocloster clostridioformis TaxID=1531 RepID=A0AAP9LZ37_9FIRM|nr:hypothetical protein [Enterocloster clostridioformis]QIX89154.1 hypothetical protein FOC47_00280 [Enterocloster clostridioformis]